MAIIHIGVGAMETGCAPDVLRTILGSCVGVTLYAPAAKIGGLAHIMLPLLRNGDTNVAKYANSAIPALVARLERQHGVGRAGLEAKLTGGATMFVRKKPEMRMLDIGTNNIKATRFCLQKLGIPIRAEDVGADYGRRVEFDLNTGRIAVRVQGQAPRAL